MTTHWTYVIWGHDGPLYVGCTNNITRRLGEHRRSGLLGVSEWIETTPYADQDSALHAEGRLIARYLPTRNIRGIPPPLPFPIKFPGPVEWARCRKEVATALLGARVPVGPELVERLAIEHIYSWTAWDHYYELRDEILAADPEAVVAA